MARLNDDAQWIILMGFLVSFSFFFLALVINQSTVVGQTTAESVIEFPKNDIRDVRNIIGQDINCTWPLASSSMPYPDNITVQNDIINLALKRKGAVVNFPYICGNVTYIRIHYNNGVTEYNENWSRI